MKNIRSLSSLLILALLSGCGGAGAGGTSAGNLPATPQGTGKATFTISIPLRTPQYLSPNMQSFQVTLVSVNGSSQSSLAPLVVNTTPSGPNCTTSGSTLTCTAEYDIPIGNDQLTMATFAGTNATGAMLSTATITQVINPGVQNTVPLTLGGVIDKMVVSLTNPAPPSGTAATIPAGVSAKDASGAIIVGPYSQSVTLATSDTANAPLSGTAITSSTATVNVNYNGAAVGPVTISATASGVPAAKITNAVMTPSGTNVFTYGGVTADSSGPNSLLLFSINHSALTFSAHDTLGVHNVSGTYTVLPNGFYKLIVTATNDPHVLLNEIVYAREDPGVSLAIEPTNSTTPPTGGASVNGSLGVLAAMVGCPAAGAVTLISTPIPTQFYNLATTDAYQVVQLSVAGSAFNIVGGTSYFMSGSADTGNPPSGSGTCANSVFSDTSGGSGAGVIGPGGILAFANGSGTTAAAAGQVGLGQPASNLNPITLAAQTYFGFVFSVDNNGNEVEAPITAGPNAGNTSLGCSYSNFEGNVPFPAIQCVTVTYNSQPQPGVFSVNQMTGAQNVNGWFVVNSINGKFVIFGIAPAVGGTPGPGEVTALVLFQQ